MVEQCIEELAATYPEHIDTSLDWIFSLTSGAVGTMKILHASISEYVLIFGTPVGTEAFSGRYPLDIHDFVLSGQMWTYTERDSLTRHEYGPGDHAVLERGQVKGFRLPDACWMLEYARGFLPAALPVVLGDVVFSAVDGRTLFKTLQMYVRLAGRELMHGKV